MTAAAAFFFLTSGLLVGGILYNLALYKKPGMYPPKRLLIKRASSLASGLGIFLFLGLLIIFLK
ncbi:hypothetical protein D1B31_00165 [Neobacillus notoginsengisoli]|uniref:Uncharacterized protein n=1 Tax=Neobacillus notoginsengisoli TaxID=1578198 RepID=A0A417YZN0_9BACI|nr:hypothetical protein [Neobacillus notoginsengisoli]RHW43131.1 hypothetical protein D1B31_00165 [Neobacillus notoginsengisoli]